MEAGDFKMRHGVRGRRIGPGQYVGRGLDRAAYAALLSATPAPAVGSMRPEDWVVESCRAVDSPGFYPARRTVDVAYLEQVLPLAEARMQLAAARTAEALHRALGKSRDEASP